MSKYSRTLFLNFRKWRLLNIAFFLLFFGVYPNHAFAQTPSAATSTVQVIPNVIPAGGTATVRVQLKDADGNDITTGGATVGFGSPSSGSLSAVSDNGDGTYTATYTAPTVPSGQTGSITFVPSLGGTSFTNTASVTFANVVVKADNATGTATGTSWVGGSRPSTSEIGLFNTTLGSVEFGTGEPLSWLGLKVTSGTDLIYIRNTSTENHVGINTGGVDMLEATRDLRIASFQQQADHTWWVPSGRTFTVDLRFTQINNAALSLYGGGTINLPGPGVSPAISTNPIVLGDISSFTGTLNANSHSFDLSVPAYETMRFAGTINNAGSLSITRIEEGGVLDFNNSTAFNFDWDWSSFTSLNGPNGDGGTYTITNNGTGKVTINPSGNIGGRSDQTLVLGGLGDGEIMASLMSGGASVSLQKDGTGTWTLSNTANGFSGTTTINDGTLEITGLLGNGTSSVGNYAKSIVNNAELKINSTSNQTLAGVISGTGDLIKDNTGTLTLSGTNTYDGNTTVSGGKLLVSGALAGTSGTYAADLVNNAEVEVNSTIDQTYDGALSGSGNWIKDGSGTWTWDGANSSTGTLTVKAGALRINENSSVPTGDIYVLNGALEFNRSSATTFDSKFYVSGTGTAPTFLNNGTGLVTVAPGNESNIGVDDNEPFKIGGSGDIRVEKSVASGGNGALLTKVGTGTVTLVSTANNYSGGTTISEGVLQIGDGTNDGTIGSGTITLTNGRLAFNRVNPYTVAETFASFQANTTPGIENNGAGLLTINASNFGFSASGITLELGGTGDGVVDGPIAFGGAAANILKDGAGTWTFNDVDNNYTGSTTINAGTLEITGRLGKGTYGQSIVNNSELKINTTSAQTLSGVISGTGDLIKDNTGTLTLSGSNTYDGNTTVSGGKLLVSGALAGTSGTYAADLVNNAEVEVNSAIDQTYDGALSGSGNWIKDGTGTWTWNGANTSTGDLTVKGGSLRINENSSVPTGDIYVLNGALEFNRTSPTTFDSKFYIAGEGSAPTFLNNGTGLVTVAPGDVSNIGVDNGEPFTIGGSGDIRLEKSVASGANAALLTKVGTGTVTLVSSANNYSGGTTISEGVLQVGDGTNDGTIGSGLITITNGRIAFNRPNPYTVTESFATFAVGTTPGIENNGAGLLTVNAGNLSFNNGAELTFGGTGNGAVDGPIAIGNAAASIIKDGNGTWTFNGDNGYTGTTTVNAGTLLVNGDQSAATGTVTVANGATLGGSGTLGGLITLNKGSVLSPGTSPGILTAANGLTINAGNTFVWELAGNSAASNQRGAAYDGVDVSGGTLTIQDKANAQLDFTVGVDFTDDFWQSPQQWLVFDNANMPSLGNVSVFGRTNLSMDANGVELTSISGLEESYFYWSQEGNDIYLNYVPLGNVSPSLSTITPASQTILVSGRATFTIQVKDSQGRNYPLASGLPTFDAPSQGTVGVSTINGDGNYSIEYNAGNSVGTEVITPKINGTPMSASFTATLVSTDDVRSGSQVLDGTSGNTQITDIFTTDGDLSLSQGFFVDYLIVGGGGGGGGAGGGGGGAGGLLTANNLLLTSQNYTVTVGGGGAGGNAGSQLGTSGQTAGSNGGLSSFAGIQAAGGGGGGAFALNAGNGASGGGAGMDKPNGFGTGIPGLGFKGGNSPATSGWSAPGGGGGFSASGTDGILGGSSGNGGSGVASSITGSDLFYAAGGGAGATGTNPQAGSGGSSIGGNGGADLSNPGQSGSANTGSGGGGGSFLSNYSSNSSAKGAGGSGGSGVVVIRYKGLNPNQTIVSNVSPSAILNDTYQLYEFTTVGSNSFDLTSAEPGATITNAIGGSGNFTYSGPGRLILEANNTYSGTTTISGGTLQIGNGDATGSLGTGAIINNATLAFNRSNTYTLGGGNIISGNGTVVQIGSGVLDLGGITSHAAGTWILRNGSLSNGTIAGDFTLESGSISAVLGGSGNLTKNTGGTVTLTGNNTYTGTTTLNSGTLVVNGTHSGTSTVSINSGATLKGSGSLSGTTTVNSGATVLAGNSIGTLGFTNLTLDGGGNLNWQIDDATGSAGTNWDQLNITGVLTINANSSNKFNINIWSLLGDGSNGELANFKPTESLYTWPIITAGSIASFDAAAFQINTGPTNGTGGLISPYQVDGFTIISDGTTISLQYDPPAVQTIDGTNNGVQAATYTTENTVGSLTLDLGFFADYLIVGGGGGGGGAGGGGGGAGGFQSASNLLLTPQNYAVTVGAGGAGGSAGNQQATTGQTAGANGGLSSFAGIQIPGGGGGGAFGLDAGNGASGGGAAMDRPNGFGTGLPGLGFEGGNSPATSGWSAPGGGGGFSAPGTVGIQGSASGNGGSGVASSITGSNRFYAAGGGAGATGHNPQAGSGGNSIGGNGGANFSNPGQAGSANTGSGGGGGSFLGNFSSNSSAKSAGGNGGSGVVIVRYAGDALSNAGGTVTSFTGNGTIGENGVTYQVHTFTSSGNFDLSAVDFDARLKATLSGNIVGSGDLIYDSEGRLTLTGSAHTYSGATEIKNGELRVNSDITSSSGVTVDAVATLSGTGTLPATTINGTHSPGNSPGLQTFSSDLTYGANSTLNWELATNTVGTRGTEYDAINVSGNLDFAGATTLNLIFDGTGSGVDWSDTFWDSPATGTNGWKLFEVTGTVSNLNNLTINVVDWADSQGALASARSGVALPAFKLVQDGNGIYISYEPLLPDLSLSTVTAVSSTIAINGTSTITVQLKDQNGAIFPKSGGTLTLSGETLGTLGSVTDNSDGTYSIVYTNGGTTGTETLTASLNGNALSSSATITIVDVPIVLPGGRNVPMVYTDNIDATGGVLLNQGFGVEYLVVGGGGGGGGSGAERAAGGGGAGGYFEGTTTIESGSYSVSIGAGGGGGYNGTRGGTGGNTVFGALTALGGGGGGGIAISSSQNPTDGASGGGGISTNGSYVASGTSGQGNNGAPGMPSGDINAQWGGGGGGALTAGGILDDLTQTVNRDGGFGRQSSITGTATYYAGGGGGGKRTSGTGGYGRARGGNGGAGNQDGQAGAANSGSGGGGAGSLNGARTGGRGGSGFVALRYPGATVATSGGGTESTITVGSDSWRLHRYTSGSATLNLDVSGVDRSTLYAEISGILSGSGLISYNAPGTLILSGANTFTGPFSIDDGTVIVEGDHSSATGSTTVQSDATLRGATTFGGAVTVKSGAFIAPGTSAGLMTFADNLTLENTATFQWELFNNASDASLRGSDYDAIDVSGTLTIGQSAVSELVFNATDSQVDFTDPFWLTDHSWVVFEGSSTPVTGGNIFGNVSVSVDKNGAVLTAQAGLGNAQFFWSVDGNNVVLNYWSGAPSALASTITASASSLKADGTSTSTLTIQLKDAQGNNYTSSYGPLVVSVPSNGALSSVTDNNDGTYTATYTAGLAKGQVNIIPQVNGVNFTNPATIELKTSGVIPASVGGLSSSENYGLDEDLTLSLGFGIEYLVVGGGGGGGGARERAAGGGGGGGVLFGPLTVAEGISYNYQVGSGGAGGSGRARGQNGGDSFFGTNIVALTATGGGGGAGLDIYGSVAATSGGSGGGGTSIGGIGGLGSDGQGYAGAQGIPSGNISAQYGGGGGGAGAAPEPASRQQGGAGRSINFTGSALAYGGGGGGGKRTSGTAGIGVTNVSGDGGADANGSPGAANTGGGGGGAGSSAQASSRTGGAGGSGLVGIRYAGSTAYTTGSSLATIGGQDYRLHTFTSGSGNLVFDFTNLDESTLTAILDGVISGDYGITYNSPGTLILSQDNTYTGSTTISNGILQVGNDGTAGLLGLGSVINNSVLRFKKSNDLSLAQDISGNGQLIKDGTGFLELFAGAYTYTGQTIIENGELRVNSSLTTSSGVLVKANGILSGTGDLPPLEVYGKHRPGNSPGVQRVHGDATYHSGAIIEWELSSNDAGLRGFDFDGIDVYGDLVFEPGVELQLVFNHTGSQVNWEDIFWMEGGLEGRELRLPRRYRLFELQEGSSVVGLEHLEQHLRSQWKDYKGRTFNEIYPNIEIKPRIIQVGSSIYLELEVQTQNPNSRNN